MTEMELRWLTRLLPVAQWHAEREFSEFLRALGCHQLPVSETRRF